MLEPTVRKCGTTTLQMAENLLFYRMFVSVVPVIDFGH